MEPNRGEFSQAREVPQLLMDWDCTSLRHFLRVLPSVMPLRVAPQNQLIAEGARLRNVISSSESTVAIEEAISKYHGFEGARVRGRRKAAYPGGVTWTSRPGLRLPGLSLRRPCTTCEDPGNEVVGLERCFVEHFSKLLRELELALNSQDFHSIAPRRVVVTEDQYAKEAVAARPNKTSDCSCVPQLTRVKGTLKVKGERIPVVTGTTMSHAGVHYPLRRKRSTP